MTLARPAFLERVGAVEQRAALANALDHAFVVIGSRDGHLIAAGDLQLPTLADTGDSGTVIELNNTMTTLGFDHQGLLHAVSLRV